MRQLLFLFSCLAESFDFPCHSTTLHRSKRGKQSNKALSVIPGVQIAEVTGGGCHESCGSGSRHQFRAGKISSTCSGGSSTPCKERACQLISETVICQKAVSVAGFGAALPFDAQGGPALLAHVLKSPAEKNGTSETDSLYNQRGEN